MNVIKSYMNFIRPELCIFPVIMALTGYLLLNPISINMVLVSLVAFFIFSSATGYNNITDKKEDIINKRKIVAFSKNSSGKFIVLISVFSALFIAAYLSIFALFLSIILVIMSGIYSHFKIKRYFAVKNIYVGIGMSLTFLIGSDGFVNFSFFMYWIIFFLFFFFMSIIADMRDYKGDRIFGYRTIPISLGIGKSKIFIYAIFLIVSSLVVFFKFYNFLLFIPFFAFMYILLSRNKFHKSHLVGRISLFLIIVSILISQTIA